MSKIHNIISREAFLKLLSEKSEGHYVYVLRKPDGIICHGGVGTPFYVGLGQFERMYAHEEEARDNSKTSPKVTAIREIWEQGGEVEYTIDSWHDQEPWDREEHLINQIGRIVGGNGPLTNAQAYSASEKIDGVETRKYAELHKDSGDVRALPSDFKLENTRLMAGPKEPKTRKSVFGKFYNVLEDNPGITGAEFVELLLEVDFKNNKSVYTQSGQVCAGWICGYIKGGYYRKDRLHFQEYKEESILDE